MTIDLLFITYNRLEYTKLSLASVLADPTEEFSLTIWDNASTDGTQEYLLTVKDPRIVRTIFAKKNVHLHGAFNNMVNKSKADIVGIIPNDFIVTPGWTRKIAEAHADIPELGMIGCWHFFPEEFNYEKAKHKIQQFGQHRILRHPWTGGNGLVKLKIVKEMGPLESNGTCGYLLRMALKGYVNGFYFPLIYVEHMDDALSKHSRIHRMNFDEACKYMPAYQHGGVTSRKQLDWYHKRILENLLTDPYDPKYYVGWRVKLRRVKKKLTKIFACQV